MEPLQKQLAELPKKLAALTRGTKLALGLGLAALVGVVAAVSTLSSASEYQYAYTNLSQEDSAEIAARLKTANVPHRFEAGGSALSVPASRVYDVRLLLSAEGLPRSGGTGFELFDKGDFGVSEFTQKINLRRATEGELARTVGRLNGVRSARVHLVLPEKGVFRGEERPASAAVMVNLHPGRTLSERELLGIRHLVASAVPSLSPSSVTIVDARGSVLSAEETWGDQAAGFQRRLEKDLEERVVSLLEPAVGAGQVVARVTAEVDASEVQSTADEFDPDGQVLKSERVSSQNQKEESQRRNPASVVGAAANQPLAPQGQQQAGQTQQKSANQSDETRNYEISRTTTKRVERAPRLSRLSVAVLLDGVDGKPREPADVQRLGELVRRAVGFDETRGDKLEISSAVFAHSAEEAPVAAPERQGLPTWAYAAIGGGALLVLGLLAVLLLRRKPRQAELVLRPGARVSELESAAPRTVGSIDVTPDGKPAPAELPVAEPKPLPDPTANMREKARELVAGDPARAAHIIRAWISLETQQAR